MWDSRLFHIDVGFDINLSEYEYKLDGLDESIVDG